MKFLLIGNYIEKEKYITNLKVDYEIKRFELLEDFSMNMEPILNLRNTNRKTDILVIIDQAVNNSFFKCKSLQTILMNGRIIGIDIVLWMPEVLSIAPQWRPQFTVILLKNRKDLEITNRDLVLVYEQFYRGEKSIKEFIDVVKVKLETNNLIIKN